MGRTIQVLSSKGDRHYTVTLNDDGKATSCDPECPGWTHRQKCRHLGEAETQCRDEERKASKTR